MTGDALDRRRHFGIVRFGGGNGIVLPPEGRASTAAATARDGGFDALASRDLVRDEHIGHRQQHRAAHQEHPSVEQRKPPADRRLRVTQPRAKARACARTLGPWVLHRSPIRQSSGISVRLAGGSAGLPIIKHATLVNGASRTRSSS